jgi:hypothetical protein
VLTEVCCAFAFAFFAFFPSFCALRSSQLEIGFLTFVVHPLYETLAKVSPRLGAKCLARIEANRAMWADIIARDEAGGARRSSMDRARGAPPPPTKGGVGDVRQGRG